MTTRLKLLLPAGTMLAGWLAFAGCQHADAPPPEEKPQWELSKVQMTTAEDLLLNDIDHALRIERHEVGAPRPEEPYRYEFGTDSSHRVYYFANLRALRLSINRRVDSLQKLGVQLPYDTTQQWGPAVHGTMRVVDVDSVPLETRRPTKRP